MELSEIEIDSFIYETLLIIRIYGYDNMTKYRNMSVLETTYDKIGMLSVAFGKEKAELMYQIIEAFFKQYEKAVAQSVKSDKPSFFYIFDITSEGRILIAPKLTVGQKKSKPIKARYSNKGHFKGVVQ